MANKNFCDKCKKEIGTHQEAVLRGNVYKIKYIKDKWSGIYQFNVDLCFDCYKKYSKLVEQFMKE